MDELTREFLIESQDGLDRMERCLTELEERPQDAGLLGDIFRSVHTIKGTTGFLGFKRLEKLAHAGENLLGLLRDGKLVATAPIITGLLQLLDGLRSILKTIEAEAGSEGTGDDSALVAKLVQLQTAGEAEAQAEAQAPAAVAAEVAAASAAPAAQAPPAQAPPPTPLPASSTPVAAAPAAPVASAAVPAAPKAEAASLAKPVVKAVAQPEVDPTKPRPQAIASAAESSLRVDVTLLNRMMNLVGELVLTRNQVL